MGTHRPLLGALAALALAACSVGGDPIRPPVADAGLDRQVPFGAYLQVSGALSSDPDGHTLLYQWALVSAPAGSAAALSTVDFQTASFVPDLPGPYVLRLTVTDQRNSASDEVTLTAVDLPPVAAAGPDQDVSPGATVALSGAGSRDPNLRTLTYAWSLEALPAGSAAALAGATTRTPSFVADLPGEYRARLTVSDGAFSAVDEVVIVARNHAPRTSAGPDLETNAGDPLQLSGLATVDPEGDAYTCRWTLTSRPAGSAAVLAGADTCTPTLTADLEGAYLLSLTASDGRLEGPADALQVTAYRRAWRLDHDVVAAEYSRALDRIVAIGAWPYRLYVIDPVGRTEAAVDLYARPTALALAPDGRRAVVGMFPGLVPVELTAGGATLGKGVEFPFEAWSAVLTGAGIACGLSSRDTEPIQCVDLGTGATTFGAGAAPAARSWARLHPGGGRVYTTSQLTTTLEFTRHDLTGGGTAFAGAAPTSTSRSTCARLWLTDDGARIVSACGDVYASAAQLGSAPGDDMVLAGALEGASGLAWVDDSTAAGRVLAVSKGPQYGSAGGELRLYEGGTLAPLGASELPRLCADGVGQRAMGRYGFWSSDGSRQIVIAQAAGTDVVYVY